MSYYFAIVSPQDKPLFEHEFGTSKAGGDGQARFPPETRHMNQFIVHASLDIVEEVQWGTGALYLKHVDRFYNAFVSCFLTPSNTRFLLLYNPDANIASGTPPITNLNRTSVSTSTSIASPPPSTSITPGLSSPYASPSRPTTSASASASTPASTSTSASTSTLTTGISSDTTSGTSNSTLFGGVSGISTGTTSSGGGTGSSGTHITQFNPTAPATEEAHRAFFAEVFDAWVKTVMNPFYEQGSVIRSAVFRGRVGGAGKKFL